MPRIRLAAAAALFLVAGAASAQLPRWSVAAAPVTVIGGIDAPEAEQLLNVRAIHQLGDGRIVVVNGKPLEVRLYDSAGHFLRRISRTGEGPGEIRYGAEVLPWPGDTIAVYSWGTRRLILLGADGGILRESPVEGPAPITHVSLYHRVFLPWRDSTSLGCARAAIDRLTLQPGLREMRADGSGHFWLRDAGAADWTILSAGGAALARVQLPREFEVYELAGNLVVGKLRDADDVEQIQVLRVRGAVAAPPCRERATAFPVVAGARVEEFKAAVRNAMTAGEAIFAKTHTYPAQPGDLEQIGYTRPEDSEIRILRTGPRGWAAMLTDRKGTLACVFAVGNGSFPGWPDGTLACGS